MTCAQCAQWYNYKSTSAKSLVNISNVALVCVFQYVFFFISIRQPVKLLFIFCHCCELYGSKDPSSVLPFVAPWMGTIDQSNQNEKGK